MATRKKAAKKKTTKKKTASSPARDKKATTPRRSKAVTKSGTPAKPGKLGKPAQPAKPAKRKRGGADVRRGQVRRETSETRISASVAIGEPGYSVATGVPFLDHMLEALSRHSCIGLVVDASGDTQVDDHHTVEDVGLALGEALREALGDKAGIYRFGHFEAPLDEALVAVTVDLSGRPYLVYNMGLKPQRVGTFDVGLVEDFFQALMTSAGMNLHINVRYGRNPHHIIEATFKAFAKALRMACAVDVGTDGVPSTKGSLT